MVTRKIDRLAALGALRKSAACGVSQFNGFWAKSRSKVSVTTTFSRHDAWVQDKFDFFPRDRNAMWDHFDVTTEAVTVKIWVVGVIGYS